MMDLTGRGILRDVTHGGKVMVVEDFNHKSAKYCPGSSSECLLVEGEGNLSKGRAINHYMNPPSPPNAKRLFRPPNSGETSQNNAMQRNMGNDHSGHSSLPFGPLPGECNDVEDISTESDEALEEDYRSDSADVSKNLVHMIKAQDMCSSALHDHNVDSLAMKENMVDGGTNLTQELLDSVGLGKPCSCSFCLKAAHMWMDLTFQDTRARLTELQRSKKRAVDQVAKVAQDFSKLSKSSKLEVDLVQHWKMILHRTQDVLVQEIAQTRSDLLARSKMMENCKRELESKSNARLENP